MIKSLLLFLGILLSVAFLTLVERKMLSYMQLRKGPNLVGVLGVMQPIGDGVKLLLKQTVNTIFSSMNLFSIPCLFFFFSLVIWLPVVGPQGLFFSQSFLFFLFLSSLSALLIFLTGWGGGSTFSFLGGVRASAQMISYEVILSFFFCLPMLGFFNLAFSFLSEDMSPVLQTSWMFLLPAVSALFIAILAETNRAPFDLTEGESELVSGFNTEFSAGLFVLLFLGEYSFIIFFANLASCSLFNSPSWWWVVLLGIVWIRACFPRKRYDLLMFLMWVVLFPWACNVLFFLVGLMYM
uniref:NADH-ubiquinone oxidoreductase chain 1 n=1 Tax=Isodiametra pulchra TaxID=504439 RepID=A0A1X9WD97_ISOPU|nr:NADH dehydrogenase subunit 1 [Isodiametra pulchra]ARS00901.1 NADH dehydrogenase subunit 1 [Isodiametra pulchra]